MFNKEFYSFSSEKLNTFLKGFDYLEEKYLVSDSELLKKLEPFERHEQQGQLQKLPLSYIDKTVGSVYGSAYEDRRSTTENYYSVFDKFINKFLNIKGLELLFNEHYYDFEWDMHLEIDFKKTEPTYYRDHMEHQIRNMYMMMVLLDDYNFLDAIRSIFLNNTSSKVSVYVKNRFYSFIEQYTYSYERKNIFLECSKSYFCKKIEDFVNNDKICTDGLKNKDYEKLIQRLMLIFVKENFWDFKQTVKDSFYKFFKISVCHNGKISFPKSVVFSVNRFKNWVNTLDDYILIKSYVEIYSINYIIRSAAIISALFHDISYPVCYFLNMRNRVGQYLPAMNEFINNVEADIDRIVTVLQPSLLFVLVSESEIRSKLIKHQKKYDHGVFSAVALLLSFYESGKIHQLPIDKQIAIELAALAIYNHNFKYYINDTEKKEYYRPIFQQNPISYLLKICDDMQEWDRKRFEISGKNMFTYCPVCMSPIIRIKEYNSRDEFESSIFCGCKGKKYFDSSFFSSRNMYTVKTCTNLDIFLNENGCSTNLIFKFNYDPLDLLYMSNVSTSYSFFISKELSNLKKLLLNQKYFVDDNSPNKIDYIYLDYSMSNNPLFLKSEIVLQYILKFLEFKQTNAYLDSAELKECCNKSTTEFLKKFKSNLDDYNFSSYSFDEFCDKFEEIAIGTLGKRYKNKSKMFFLFGFMICLIMLCKTMKLYGNYLI